MSTKNRHSYVAFYTSDWLAGTARMTRLVKSVYHDVCLYNWDKNEPAPESELKLMLADLEGQGERILDALVEAGRLLRNGDGSVYSERAMAEAAKSYDLWERKSKGGKKGASTTNGSAAKTPAVDPDPDPDPEREDSGESSLGSGDGEAEAAPKPRKTYNVNTIADAWNAMALGAALLKRPLKLTDERRGKVRARLDENTEAEILEAISLIPERPFCMGENNRGWKADFDWFLRPNSISSVLEGTKFMSAGKGDWRGA